MVAHVGAMTAPALPSVRGFGSASSFGDGSHGRTARAGAGHGRVRFSGGQRLTGDQARSPTSIVGKTVK